MPMIYRGSNMEDIAAWILDAIGLTPDLSSCTGTVQFYDPTTGEVEIEAGGTVTCSSGTGDGVTTSDDPNIVIELSDDAVELPPNTRWRMLVDATVGGEHVVRTWPYVVRPGLPVEVVS